MRQAGVREARQQLSVLLGYVQDGHEVLITDRGRPVARLVAPLPLSARPFASRSALRRGLAPLQPPLSERLGAAPGGGPGPVRRPLPGPLYLDATALAVLYLPEPGSASLEGALRGRRDLTVSDLAVTEFLAALAPRRDELGPARLAARVPAALLEDLESGVYRRAELSPQLHRSAERLALSLARPQRPAHLLHLALALTAGVASLITLDPELARVAHGVGLQTPTLE